MSIDEIAARYDVSRCPARRWIKEQPEAWQQERAAIIAQRKAAAYASNVQKAWAARKAKARVKPPKPKYIRAKPAPASILDDLCAMPVRKVAEKHGVARGTADRWAAELSPKDKELWKGAVEARRVQSAKDMQHKALAAIQARVEAKRAAAPPKPKRVGRVKNWGYGKPIDVPAPSGGVVAMAAQHLRRVGFIPVVRGDVLTKAMKGYYVVGRLRLPEAEMVDLARARGFDPDAWRQVAA